MPNQVPSPIDPMPALEPCDGKSRSYLQPIAWAASFASAPQFGAEGRLPDSLRQGVRQGAAHLFRLAVLQAHLIDLVAQSKPTDLPAFDGWPLVPTATAATQTPRANPFLLNPYLGLVVSSGGAHSAFQAWVSNQSQTTAEIVSLVQFLASAVSIPTSLAQPIVQQAWTTVVSASQVLYAPIVDATARQSLGWIPVSGEDDSPTRPINVPTMPYPQTDMYVTVNRIPVRTRIMVATTDDRFHGSTDIPPTGEVMFFIHGHMSKIEEAADFAPQLIFQARAAGRPLTLVMFDQPSSGYSAMIDHSTLDPTLITFPDGDKPGDPNSPFGAALLKAVRRLSATSFVKAHIVALVNALDQKYLIANRLSTFVGGSLGGHMGVRFACDGGAWPQRVVAWSPASMWSDNSVGPVTIKTLILDGALKRLVPETNASGDPVRADYFATVFDNATNAVPHVPAQPLMWYRAQGSNEPHALPPKPDDWPCKASLIANARLERREIYNRLFRDWHWRLAAEMCHFNFLDESPVDSATPYYNRIARPLLLMAGVDDDYDWVGLYTYTKKFVGKTWSPNVVARFPNKTGHSIHNERPAFLATQVLTFGQPAVPIGTAPGCALNSAATGIKFFVGGGDGHLWENFWDGPENRWRWTDHGWPGAPVDCAPGALFNSPQAGLKFFVKTGDGRLLENIWDPAANRWAWTDHGTPPGTTVATAPDCALDDANTGIKFFMGGSDGHLWENYWDASVQHWGWTDHGTPPGTMVGSAPGALFNSPRAGLKFFVRAADGRLMENHWDQGANKWSWTDHGTPPGTTVATTPGCPLDSPNSQIKFFMGGVDGRLWERYWDQSTSQWRWTDHGTPPGTEVASTPGALFNSPRTGLKLFVRAADGRLMENYWDASANIWSWTDHGTPPGTTVATAAGCALDSANSGIKLFIGGADGHLWENCWDSAASRWSWTDHGTP